MPLSPQHVNSAHYHLCGAPGSLTSFPEMRKVIVFAFSSFNMFLIVNKILFAFLSEPLTQVFLKILKPSLGYLVDGL